MNLTQQTKPSLRGLRQLDVFVLSDLHERRMPYTYYQSKRGCSFSDPLNTQVAVQGPEVKALHCNAKRQALPRILAGCMQQSEVR